MVYTNMVQPKPWIAIPSREHNVRERKLKKEIEYVIHVHRIRRVSIPVFEANEHETQQHYLLS